MYNLDEVYKNLLTGKISCSEAAEILKSNEIQSSINHLVYKNHINNLIPYSEEDLQFIYMIVNIAQYIYNNSGAEGITDSQYDSLYSIMLYNGGADVVSAPVSYNYKNVSYHKYPALRGTLSKVYYLTSDEKRTNPARKYLDEWIASKERDIYDKTGRNVNLNNEEVYVFPKFDGVSGVFEMTHSNKIENVLTRGFTETNEAQNITHIFDEWYTRSHHEFRNKEYGLKTEIMMQEDKLDYYNAKYHTDYKNTRSIVSAIINSDEYDEEKSSLLEVVPLRVGTESGDQELAKEVFESYPFIRCRLGDREVIRRFAIEHAYVHGGLRCDGAVIHIINPELQSILGRDNNINNYEVAYKFTEEVAFSELIDVNFNMGLFGRIAPVAKVKPVKLKGNTIENISLGSVGRFKSLGLCKGDTVKVLYDIIPYLSFDDECRHNGGEPIQLPKICPECSEDLIETDSGDILSCVNPKCPCRVKGKILNFLNKMNIDNISYAIIDKLYLYGIVKKIEDIYSLEKHSRKICDIEGFGPSKLTQWLESIESRRSVHDSTLLGSLGIEGVSKKTFSNILSVLTMDELLDICLTNKISKLVALKGVKEITAKKIITGIEENIDLILFLVNELDVIQTLSENDYKFSVCFTKVRDIKAEEFITEHGGKIDNSLTKTTSILVVPFKDTESSKVEKARKYDIPVVPISELEDYINNNYS